MCFQWHELQVFKSPLTLFSISFCVLPAISGKLIDYKKTKQNKNNKQKKNTNKLWFKSVISDGYK